MAGFKPDSEISPRCQEVNHFLKMIKKLFYKLIRKSPADMEMVSYWKFKDSVSAKVMRSKEGNQIMIMEGEKYPFSSFPRGHILFGKLSKLKHEIKNQIFNDSWWNLEKGISNEEIIFKIKDKLFNEIPKYYEPLKYDAIPIRGMCPAIKEIYRAWTKVSPKTGVLRDYLCFILQEDDSYRNRVQWLATWFGWFMKWNPVKSFEYALSMLEHGEVIGDMKERARLLKRILMLVLEDRRIRNQFILLFREINWKKVKLTKADKYHFRGKYFKVDLNLFDY